ncbi:hypothetical protein TPA0906_67150 [Streptomyces olivaceus]|uniref:hypothetical protein n=1 Tax=Streptomyces olivaceus TaxID=47716 RepID=UPI001CCE4D5E|nr:hypothetical protein [Streptomyces olivaceus]MBZ6290453.1 hypothetical protein [Streptomyces olivaceus]MBZ6324405.1 hypothetical protein [Streptomyces olivaceus]GHJ04850.1 hypothetical protein TPA0906_67150 [Streptomyces olivaceus]
MTAGRYRVTVTTAGDPLIQGWWGDETVARRKFSSWVGEHGSRAGARVTLVDEETGERLTEWPDPA